MANRYLWRIVGGAAAAALLAACGTAGAQQLAVSRLVLPNGLRVLALEDHTVPSVAIHTVFKVGSRNERTGRTGLSHLFEHMMFNGSAHYPPKVFDQVIEAGGGYSNAETGTDTTEYYEEMSTPTLDAVLRMEADRMRALRLDKQNLEQERGIVEEERRSSYDNSVGGTMEEALWNAAFVAHSYHWLPIGFMKDIAAITLADARAYFAVHYAPNNAVVAVVGDFRTPDLFARIRRYYGTIPRHTPPGGVVRDEPPQTGERRVEVRKPAELPAVTIAYHNGTMFDRDDPALDLLSDILAAGESSRLYRALVYEQRIASSVWSSNDSRVDPGLFTFYVQAQSGHTAAECEAGVLAAIADIQKNGVTARELQKAKNITRAGYVGSFKTNGGRARMLAEYEALWGDWHRLLQTVPLHDRVTADDVKRVAVRYLAPANRTVATLVPTGPVQPGEGGGEGPQGGHVR